MAGNFCRTCHFYSDGIFTRVGESFGICTNPAVNTKVVQDNETKLSEENTLYTEEYFGCVYWRENDGSLLSFDDIIDNDTGKPK